MAVFTLVPTNNRVNSRFPFGDAPAANDPPFLAIPLPTLVGQVNSFFSFDFDTYFDDPDGDPLTYTITGLPSGVTQQGSTGLVQGTPTTEGQYLNVTAQARDPDGLTSDVETTAFTVAAEPEMTDKPLRWPNMTFGLNASGRDRCIGDSASDTQQIISWRTTAMMVQALIEGTAGGRRQTRTNWLRYRDNRIGKLVIHHDMNQVVSLSRPNFAIDRVKWDAVIRSGGDWIYQDENRNWYGRQSSASLQTRQLPLNHVNAAYRAYIVNAWLNMYYSQNPDEFLADIVHTVHCDGMSDWLRKSYCRNRHNVAIDSVSGNKREFTFDDYPGLPLGGDPDGDGFESVTQSYMGWLYKGSAPSEQSRTISDMDGIASVQRAKRIGGGKITILANPPRGLETRERVDNTWRIQLMITGGETTCSDPDQNGTRNCQNGDDMLDPNSENYLRVIQGYKAFFDEFDAEMNARQAQMGLPVRSYGRVPNAVAGAYLSWWQGRFVLDNHAWKDDGDWVLGEHVEDGRTKSSHFDSNGTADYEYRITAVNDQKWYFGKLLFGESYVRKGSPKDLGFIAVTGVFGVTKSVPAEQWRELDYAIAGFYHMMQIMGGNGIWGYAGTRGNSEQVMTELLIWNPNGAPIDPATGQDLPTWRFATAIDGSTRGGPNNVTLRPSDFGDLSGFGQYIAHWRGAGSLPDGALTMWSMRRVTADRVPWTPSFLPGGQAVDQSKDGWVIEGLPPGIGLYDWNPRTYRDPASGENVREGIYVPGDGGQGLGRLDSLFEEGELGYADGLGKYRGTNGDIVFCPPGEFRLFIKAPIP